MKPHRCCQARSENEVRSATSPLRRIRNAAEWALPGAILVAMPKCPACVAGYIALATGLGISLSVAAQLRLLVLTLCLGTLVFLGAKRVIAWRSLRRRKAVRIGVQARDKTSASER
jgi:hypothetical protein